MKDKNLMTVKELNSYIKTLIENDDRLFNIYVRGEISNFTNHYKTGHYYFTLKDEEAVIRAVMFKSSVSRIKFIPQNGMKIIARGRVSVFERDGQYQLYVEDMISDGAGDLHLAFEQLKNKLLNEGLFELSLKKPLPKIPFKIGVVTSPTGAAISDILNILKRRFPLAKVIIYPVLVQGNDAPPQIVEAINYFNIKKNVDLIITGRGGGSIEELWAFNDEKVARCIVSSKIPVISAVGHETDFTIADFAADLRAPTPSAAAELAVPDSAELIQRFNNYKTRLLYLLTENIKAKKDNLNNLRNSRIFLSPQKLIDDKRLYLDFLVKGLVSEFKLINSKCSENLSILSSKLNALNPLAILERGYSIILNEDKQIVKSIKQLKKDDTVTAYLSDGKAVLKTKEVNKKKEGDLYYEQISKL